MPSVRLLLKWSGLAAVVSAVTVIAYFITIPLLLPFLWPATRLPLAILFGMVLLLTALVRDVDSYLPIEERPTAADCYRGAPPDYQRLPTAGSQPSSSSNQYRRGDLSLIPLSRPGMRTSNPLMLPPKSRVQHPRACVSKLRDITSHFF